jgi:tetratricopeptide (TPR) repeat protein
LNLLNKWHSILQYCELLGDSAKNKAAALVSIAASYADMRMFDDAIKYYNIELELWAHEPKEEFRSRLNLASVYEKKGNPKSQLDQLNHARSLAQQVESPSLEIEVLVLLQSYHKANTEIGQNLQGTTLKFSELNIHLN